jgi:hypothetical protein
MFLNCRLINLTLETNGAFQDLFCVFSDFYFFCFPDLCWPELMPAIVVGQQQLKKRFDAAGMFRLCKRAGVDIDKGRKYYKKKSAVLTGALPYINSFWWYPSFWFSLLDDGPWFSFCKCGEPF